MRFLRSVLLASSCLLSSVSTATLDGAADPDDVDGAAAAEQTRTHEVYTMGFEAETSGIKIQHTNEDEILVILESSDEKWQLTSDTQDDRIDSSNWVNLECRTQKGLTQEEIKRYIIITQKVIRKIKEICDSAANGQFTFDNLNLAQDDIRWGSCNPKYRKLNHVTFATKRQASTSLNEKIKLMTAYNECLEIFVFYRPENTIGVEVSLADNKQLDNSAVLIEDLTQKLTFEFNTMAQISGEKGWQFDNISIANLYGSNLKDHLFKPALPLGTSLTFSTAGLFVSLDCTLRPQLTFSFPISMMSVVFSKVLHQEHSIYTSPRIFRVAEVLSDIDDAIREKKTYIQEDSGRLPRMTRVKKAEIVKLEEIRDAVQDFWASERTIIEPLFTGRSNLNGLCILTAEYILDLFILNQLEPNVKEPGLKPFVKVMSRLSFSGMFNDLTDMEKEEFISWCSKFTDETLNRLVKPYRKDAPGSGYEQSDTEKKTVTEGERINLRYWLASISTPINRMQIQEAPLRRDALSPPLYTSKTYSMGAVSTSDISCSHAIIEARGYCEVKINSLHYPSLNKVSIDNIIRLINDEARKFFALDKGESL